jgi:glycerophosphoryl diester phosphodiesterase
MSELSDLLADPGRPPVTIGFAHRGARIAAPENTIEAFRLALDAGARGLETDCWLSADDEVVCVHDATVAKGLRRRKVRQTSAAELADFGVPRLADVYAQLGTDYDFSIDAKHDEVIGPMLDVAAMAGATDRLWVCHPDFAVLAPWRPQTAAHLVHSRLRGTITTPIERHAHDLSIAGIEAMNFHHTEWTAGLVSLFHRFAIKAFAWDAQEVRHLRAMVAIGIDAVYCDRPDRLVATLSEWS